MILGGEHPDGWDTALVDPRRQPHPTPCPDCGRTYLNGENVTVAVPTSEPNGSRTAWSGCVDCWVVRSRPAPVAEREDVKALAEALFQWNSSTDPYFVINGRFRADEEDDDPYLPIARAALASPWFADALVNARREVVERFEALADEYDASAARCAQREGVCCSSCVGRQIAARDIRRVALAADPVGGAQ